MTRVQQWFRRRSRYLFRLERYRNNKTRPRHTPPSADPYHKGGHQSPLGVIYYGKQPPPKVSAKTYKIQKPDNFDFTFGHSAQVDGTGYGDPPHWKIEPASYGGKRHHYKRAVMSGPLRAVIACSRPRGRYQDRDVLSFKAFIWWTKRRKWPAWDPKGRVPVDIYPYGPDDPWDF